ncbi:MAG: hypothetical protein WBW53_21315 [Terriglobales bacterium]
MTTEETNWRKLCALAAEEKDPKRLFELVEQLIQALDHVMPQLAKNEQNQGKQNQGEQNVKPGPHKS